MLKMKLLYTTENIGFLENTTILDFDKLVT